ncbi:MAG: hypothetical protein U5M53_12995 [Rhodoferax sp.]|nr:hypothetical protein [Rhodoferax sp.]
MTENTQTSLLSEICALTSRIKGAICAQVAAVAVSSYGYGVYAGVRKILSL